MMTAASLKDESGTATVETAVAFVAAALCVAGGTAWVFRGVGALRNTILRTNAAEGTLSLDPCVFCGRLDTGLRVSDTVLDCVDWITGRIGGR